MHRYPEPLSWWPVAVLVVGVAGLVVALATGVSFAQRSSAAPQKPRCIDGYVWVYIHGDSFCLPGYKPTE